MSTMVFMELRGLGNFVHAKYDERNDERSQGPVMTPRIKDGRKRVVNMEHEP